MMARAAGGMIEHVTGGGERNVRGVMKYHEPMARHCSWRVGGPADEYFVPADLDDLCRFLAERRQATAPVWLGLGSNLLIRDGGIRGTVIAVAGVLGQLELTGPSRVRAGAGVASAKLARFSAAAGLTGAEFLAGIPGTVGGALAMNAGAFGGETWNIVHSADTVDRGGRVTRRERERFETGYRQVSLAAGEWFVGAEFELQPDAGHTAPDRIREFLGRRAATQPTGEANCGSVFRNPPGDHAGRLIEACGLKGRRLGGAQVSSKHANFIINLGAAKAADIEGLIVLIQRTVLGATGVRLEPEVRIIGEPEPWGREQGT